MILRILLFSFWTVFGVQTFGQNTVRHFTSSDGLISNNVYCSLQDQNGYLWFGTDRGVSKFDGTNFENYTIDNGLTDNEVLKLFEDSDGRIWFLTYNGIPCFYQEGVIYNPQKYPALAQISGTGFFTHAIETHQRKIYFFKSYDNEYYTVSEREIQAHETSDSSIFIATLTYQNQPGFVCLKRLDNQKLRYSFRTFEQDSQEFVSVVSEHTYVQFIAHGNQILALKKSDTDPNQHYWVHINYWQDLNKDSLQRSAEFEFVSLISVSSLDEEIFTVTDKGITTFRNDLTYSRTILPNNYTSSFITDYTGGMWVSTRFDGIYQLSDQSNYRSVVANYSFHQIKQNPYAPGEMWCIGDGSILKIDAHDSVTIYSTSNYLGNENPSDIGFLKQDELLIGSGKGLLHFKNGEFRALPSKSGIKQIWISDDSIYIARSSELTVQTYDQLFKPLDYLNLPYTVLHSGRTICLALTNNNQILGGDNQGAFEINLQKPITEKRIEGISNRIKKIIAAKDVVFLGSDVAGVFILDANGLIHISAANGLISNAVNSMAVSGSGILWVATDKGLSQIDINQKTIQNFNENDGLPDNRINDLQVINDSTLLIATPIGLYEYTPKSAVSNYPPKLYIRAVKINESSKEIAPEYHLNHSENNIEIELAGVAFNDDLTYYYSLNTDTSQMQKIAGRTLNFVNLPSGEHTVILKCQSKFDIWSNAIQLKFIIDPPFYETTLFLLIVTICIFLIILWILYLRQSRKNKKRQVELTLSETRQKALQAQLNPHFVFNALNSIQYLFMSGKEAEANNYLADFSVLLRNILKHTDKTYITLHEEITNLSIYVELEQRRTENKFSFELHIDPAIDVYQLQIPVMLIQPFIENAIWHGFQKADPKGILTLGVEINQQNQLVVSISDNGIGFTPEALNKSHSKGVKLIRERIEAMNKIGPDKIDLSIESNSHGTKIEFRFPIKY